MKFEHSTYQRYGTTEEIGWRRVERFPTGSAVHAIQIEYTSDEFRGDAKWMWELALGLLNVVAAVQKQNNVHYDFARLMLRDHGLRYLRGLSPEAATLIGLIVDGQRET